MIRLRHFNEKDEDVLIFGNDGKVIKATISKSEKTG